MHKKGPWENVALEMSRGTGVYNVTKTKNIKYGARENVCIPGRAGRDRGATHGHY